jgi:hypothetical protein
MSRVDAVVALIKNMRAASRLCSEMACDTADNADSAAEFEKDGCQIDGGYCDAIEAIETGDLVSARDILEGVRRLEAAGGDDQHSHRSIEALSELLGESEEA